jgi:hypothetical protein
MPIIQNKSRVSPAFTALFMLMHFIGALILFSILFITVITINHGILVFIASA